MLQAGTVICAKYEIIKEIGRGGMSVVYQARDKVTGKLLAIKDVERNGKEDNRLVMQSLSGEGRLLKRLNNPHLPRIYEIIEDTDSFMVVMDFIEGISLDKVIGQNGPQKETDVYQWGMQICEVFDYLHKQTPPIVYRDMKPANIMLQADGNIMMIDFGTARTQKIGLAMQSDTVCIGTEGFAAPEQFGGISQSDARTDIFCLGATLYNMVTGHSPSDRPKGILPLEYWNKELARSPLCHIIQKCTRNDPAERYQTAMELHADLRLASLGSFREQGKRNSGRLRKNGWQKQEVKGSGGNAGAISGLLDKPKGKSGTFRGTVGEAKAPPQQRQDNSWQRPMKQKVYPPSAGQVHALPQFPPAGSAPAYAPPATVSEPLEEPQGTPAIWRRIMLIAALTAIVLIGISLGLLLAGLNMVAYVMLILSGGAFALMIAGAIGTLNNRS